MKQAKLPLREIGMIAATRGMAGAGIGMLLAGRMDSGKRKKIGWPLLIIGALSTIPLLMDVLKKAE